MQLRLVILSVGCIACLIPSAVSFKLNLSPAKAVAAQAKDDIASIGAKTIAAKKAAVAQAGSDIANIAAQGVALKGQALTKAATSMAGALINGAMSVGSTIARAGLNMIIAKFSGKPSLVYEPPTVVFKTPVVQDTIVEEAEPIVVEYDQVPLQPSFEVVGPAMPYDYEIVEIPQGYGPLMETLQFGKK